MKKLFNGLETDYLDGFQYKFTHTWEAPSGTMNNDGMKLRIIPTSEGYFDALRNAYFYNYTDHLGNVRLSYSDRDKNGEVTGDIVVNNCVDTPDGQFCNNYIISREEEGVTNYYPFGMIHNNEYNNFDSVYQNKYNGKELQETGMYDYGARFYMSDIGRWGVVDPLAESSRRFTPYHYGNNNPVRFIDPDGRQSWDNLTTYNPGSAVMDFLKKNGFGGEDIPLVFSDDAGMMMTSALGNDGEGGGSGGVTLGDLIDAYSANDSTDYFAGIDFTQFGAEDCCTDTKLSLTDQNGKKVLDAKETFLEKLWATLEPRTWTDSNGMNYNVGANGRVTGIRPYMGDAPIGPAGSFNILKAYKSGLSLFKGGNNLTNIGRAVTKHPQYFGFESTEALMKAFRSPSAINRLGSDMVKDIVRNGVKSTGAGGRYPQGWVT